MSGRDENVTPLFTGLRKIASDSRLQAAKLREDIDELAMAERIADEIIERRCPSTASKSPIRDELAARRLEQATIAETEPT